MYIFIFTSLVTEGSYSSSHLKPFIPTLPLVFVSLGGGCGGFQMVHCPKTSTLAGPHEFIAFKSFSSLKKISIIADGRSVVQLFPKQDPEGKGGHLSSG